VSDPTPLRHAAPIALAWPKTCARQQHSIYRNLNNKGKVFVFDAKIMQPTRSRLWRTWRCLSSSSARWPALPGVYNSPQL